MLKTKLLNEIKKAKSEVFRRVLIKRRLSSTGLFESDWLDITKYVKKFGKISTKIDDIRVNKFTFGNVQLTVDNENGLFSNHESDSSLWYNYLNQQRTLVQYEAGFRTHRRHADGYWINNELPESALWDVARFDDEFSLWDQSDVSAVFTGVISGDIYLDDTGDVSFNIKPLTSIFQEYPAQNLTGWTSTGMTASQFVTMLRDQTDGSSNFIFRPFFGDTISNWDISATSIVYSNLNTSTSKGVFNKNAWEVVEGLAESENYVPYVTRDGIFKFVSRSLSASSSFEFYGAGTFNTQYGQTIKTVSDLGFRTSKFYPRVKVKFLEPDTNTSYYVVESAFTVSAGNNGWVLGVKTLSLENLFIPNTATAQTIATTLFNEFSLLKKEVQVTTSFIPGLDILDRFGIYYDPNPSNTISYWDQQNWGGAGLTATVTDLVFDVAESGNFVINGDEFRFVSLDIDLDNLSNRFLAREL